MKNSAALERITKAREAEKTIRSSFIEREFKTDLIRKINHLVIDDVHVDEAALSQFGWTSIYTEDNDGYLDSEIDLLINWCKEQSLDPIFVTSPARIRAGENSKVLVMELCSPSPEIFIAVQSGDWMFDELSDLAQQRLADWRSDVYFTASLDFLILLEHGAYGTTTICGPKSFIEMIKAETAHGLYEWSFGTVPKANKGSAFPKA
ncbi:MAG: hypothetical protein CVV11_15185 [Gammaproteobacteria bacterium HGW-Gammaproteobacteria-15]|nr:MAG: hypothetical protein CVV11_15185 [Gammaproteobacteria bacterium HGW-Gammaproteobacteria-15]